MPWRFCEGGEEGFSSGGQPFFSWNAPRSMRIGPRHHAGTRAEMVGFGWDALRRFLRPTILLLLAEEPVHGYELMNKLKELGVGRGADPSLVYRILRALEGSGLAESRLDDSGAGPARKVYALTPQGMEMLDLWMSNLDEVFELLQQLRERYQKLGKS